jgi:hypothetical protein
MARLLPPRTLFTSVAFTWLYLAGLIAAEITYAALSPHDRGALLQWASTDVVNLRHDPVGCLVVSAFFPSGSLTAWPVLAALAMFGANRVLGNWRTLLVCAAGHVIGTLVSEGIVGYRVAHGLLPAADRHIIDVGPSYVVVSAIVVAVLYGSWLARAAAVLDLALLVFVGDIFSGLSRLVVAAVGHTTAIAVAAVLGSFLVWRLRRAGPWPAAGRDARLAGRPWPSGQPGHHLPARHPEPAREAGHPEPGRETGRPEPARETGPPGAGRETDGLTGAD